MPIVKDLYRESVVAGHKVFWEQQGKALGADEQHLVKGPEGPEYWIARHAAREATDAVLAKAKEIGVTDEQWEALRAVAADVAYD